MKVLAAAFAVALGACMSLAGTAFAQKYPVKPVRIVVGFQPGGGTDIAARVIAQKLAESLGGSFIVDNRPGAAGNLAADIVAKAGPDGYTLFMANSTIAIPSLFKSLPFDVRKDLAPLSNIALGPSVLIVRTDLAAPDIKGLIALAKSKPGQLTYGSGGLGNITHLAMAHFSAMSGIEMVHVPYKGSAPSLVGLMGGEVQLLFTSVPAALPHVNANRVRALGVSINERSAALPKVPTIAEAGLPGYYAASWYGLLLPAGTPRAVVGTLSKEIVTIMKVPDVREKMLAQGAEPAPTTPAEFAAFIAKERDKYARIVKASGARID